jgi:hypothetical protein
VLRLVLLSCSDNNLPFRDTSGFRKLIVLLTDSGKVFGLHSGDARILWTSSAPSAAAAAAGSSSAKQHLRVWKRFHDLTHAPQLAVISAGGEGGSSSLLVLNGHTGEVLQEQQLPYAIDKVGGVIERIISLLSASVRRGVDAERYGLQG